MKAEKTHVTHLFIAESDNRNMVETDIFVDYDSGSQPVFLNCGPPD